MCLLMLLAESKGKPLNAEFLVKGKPILLL